MSISVVLLDLDDTLLESNMTRFIPAYLDKLAGALSVYASREQVETAVRSGVAAMRSDTGRITTNYEIFLETFLALIPGRLTGIQQAIDRFYREDYPTLQSCVRPRPAAQSLVASLKAAGYTVVLATNPLYPRTAIEQRMAWAGVLNFSYALITCQENMYASKPSLAYYRQILEMLNITPNEALMIGNDPRNDIAPSQELGLTTWWITDLADTTQAVKTDFQGTLAQCCCWVQNDGLLQLKTVS